MSVMGSTSSDQLAVGTTTVVPQNANYQGGGLLCGLSIVTAAAAGTVTVYDNGSTGAGKILAQLAKGANDCFDVDYAFGLCYNKGLTVVVTGTGATAVLRYTLGG